MTRPSPPAGSPTSGPALTQGAPLPYRWWWPCVAGALAGLALRLLFSDKPGHTFATMTGTFILLSPVVVGAVTVYIAERRQRRSWAYYFLAPSLANVLYVAGSLAILIEGIICAILIVPLFALLGGLGGLAMGAICRLTHWPRQTMYSLASLPLVLAFVEAQMPLPDRIRTVERELHIDAPPAAVWQAIHQATDIRPEEVGHAWMYRIGVPLPHAGVSEHTDEGRVRRITMGKGVHFDQVVEAWEEERRVRWRYRFHPDSFPPGALDDHVMIGGHYFDLIDTAYTLTPAGDGTLLGVRMGYRVSTRFNWYADPIAQWLIGNFEEVILGFYRRRAEATIGNTARIAMQGSDG